MRHDPGVDGLTPVIQLELEPTSTSAAQARRATTEALRQRELAELAADVGVVVSELVTNAVLHARSRVEVRLTLLTPGVLLEVSDDGNGEVELPNPALLEFDEELGVELEATTGRGLLIVTALADSWGVDTGPDGKVVWAELGTGRAAQQSEPTPPEPPAPPQLDALTPTRLIAVPTRLILASEGNIEDLTRELQVARLSGRSSEAGRLFELAQEVLAHFEDASTALRRAATAAWEEGRRLIDWSLPLDPDAGPSLQRVVELLEEVAEHCRAGELLALAPSDEVLALRRWIVDQLVRQLAGERPTACPFPVSPPEAANRPAAMLAARDERAQTLLAMQALTTALAGADDGASVSAIVLDRVADLTHARSCSLNMLSADGESLELAGTSGYSAEVTAHWSSYPLSADLPASEAVRTRRPIFVRTLAELATDYPALEGRPRVGDQAIAVLPLVVADGRALGALALGYEHPRDWDQEDRAVLGLAADAIAQALDRARLHDAERAAADRLRFLAEASDVLSQSLDLTVCLGALAELAVPRLGDWCSIHVLQDGQPRSIALAAADTERLAHARTLQARWPVQLGEGAVGRCLVDGTPGLWQSIPDELLPTVARDPEHLEALRALGVGSGLVVPLVSGGAVVGALAVANVSGRLVDQADVDLAQDLASRAGAALTNARLFDGQRSIAQALQRSLLPQELPEVPGVELGVAYAAAGFGEEVGGDFYDFLPLPGGLLLSIGDVRGRGVEAAALTGLARHTIRALGRLRLGPAQVLLQLDAALRELATVDEPETAFCTALTGLLELDDNGGARFVFASGGHPAPFLLRHGAIEVQRPSVRGDLLGILDEPEILDSEVPLAADDLLVLVTDGILERRAGPAFFDDEGVSRVMVEHAGAHASDLAAAIADAARNFGAEATSDDMAVVVLRVGHR